MISLVSSRNSLLNFCYDFCFIHAMFTDLPFNVKEILQSYIPENDLRDIKTWYEKNSILPRFLNLTNPEVMRAYCYGADERYLAIACNIAKTVYEILPVRLIGQKNKYGVAYPINPEVMAHAMELAKDEIVLEIAGASGENAILLAFAGSRKVFLNDIEPTEIAKFHELKKQLPKDVSEKLESIEGSCFDILELRPELHKKVGLIVCRNLIHFFTDKQIATFFQLLKQLLKPGGRVILTANSIAPLRNEQIPQRFPNHTSFSIVDCFILNYGEKMTTSPKPIHRISYPCPGDMVRFDSIPTLLFEKSRNAWKINEEGYNSFDPSIISEISNAILAKIDKYPIESGVIMVYQDFLRCYSPTNLAGLFESYGFEVQHTFAVKSNGHLGDFDIMTGTISLGVIAKIT